MEYITREIVPIRSKYTPYGIIVKQSQEQFKPVLSLYSSFLAQTKYVQSFSTHYFVFLCVHCFRRGEFTSYDLHLHCEILNMLCCGLRIIVGSWERIAFPSISTNIENRDMHERINELVLRSPHVSKWVATAPTGEGLKRKCFGLGQNKNYPIGNCWRSVCIR